MVRVQEMTYKTGPWRRWYHAVFGACALMVEVSERDTDVVLPELPHPRPQFERADWVSLDGPWEFAIDPPGSWSAPDQVEWGPRAIQVPFAPETTASGISETGFYCACWYRRTFQAAHPGKDRRQVLHFGAVDYSANVWINGRLAVQHEGGYTPFSCDITELLASAGAQEVVVRAEDNPHDLGKPRGKQDWQLNPHSIWY